MASAHARGISDEALWAAHARLKAAHAALGQAWAATEDLREATQRELASAGAAMGLSLPQIVSVLALVLPRRLGPSRATVGRWVPPSAQHSRGLREGLARACQRWVLVWCLEAIFLHREPLVMGLAPLRLAGLAAPRGPDRRGARWCKGIAAWPQLAPVIAAGGQGRARGVTLAKATRRQAQEPAAESPAPITMGLDVLHTERELERV